MKSFFQRKQDSQPNPRSHTPANEPHKRWFPPQDRSRSAAPAPAAWAPAPAHAGARKGGEKRSASRADASAVPTSSAYKYATLPNSTGFYYSNNPAPLAQPVPVQPYPSQQYYPPPAPRAPPPERPDSRLGYAPYPYPNPQYPQAFAAPPPAQPAAASSKKREENARNTNSRGPSTVPAAEASRGRSSRPDDANRVPRKPSSSSIREQQREDAEVKKPKHRPREPSETRKRRDSKVGDPYAEKRRDKSSRKESRRDGRADEGDSSDSSVQRPSLFGARRRSDEGKSSMPENPQQGTTPFLAPSRTGWPVQPTAPSSSSGKHTPQIPPRMPVYLPANHGRSQRVGEDQPGQSGSDTDHGNFNRGRNFPQSTAQNSKQPAKPTNALGGPSTLTMLNKKVKESKGLWPFSRRSSQKLPQNPPTVAPNIPAKKTRAESTPSRFPIDDRPTGRPEHRRNASDNAIGLHFDAPETRSSQPEAQSSTSRALFFATQANESSSRLAAAPQQAALHPFQSRSAAEAPPNPGGQAVSQPPPIVATSSSSRQNPAPQTGFLPGQAPETQQRRDGRDMSTLPPLYGPPAVPRASDYPRAPDRSTTPKVSQLVAGFEARSSEAHTHMHPPQAAKPPPMAARREVTEKPSLSHIYAPPQQGPGNGPTSAQTLAAVNPYANSSQPPRTRTISDSSIRPPIDSSNNVHARPPVNQPETLQTALRELLTDKPAAPRNDERSRRAPESRNHQTSAPPAVYPNPNSSQPHPFTQPPIQAYGAGISTSSKPSKSTSKGEMPPEVAPHYNLSSKRPEAFHSDSADRTLRQSASSRPGDDGTHEKSSRSKREKEKGSVAVTAVMKTPSKDSSRHTSTPSPVVGQLTHQSRSNDKSSPSRPSTSRSQSQPAYPEPQIPGRHVPALVPLNPPSSSVVPGERTSHRDHRPPTTKQSSSRDLATSSTERARPAPSTSVPFPSNPPLPVSSRSPAPASGPTPVAEARSGPRVQSGSRPAGSSAKRHSMRRVSSDESILMTPSSLAHSVLPPLQPTVSQTKRKGMFAGMFRSKEPQEPESHLHDRRRERPPQRRRSPDRRERSPDRGRSNSQNPKSNVPAPITVPHPSLPISERKSPNSRVFTPFRYLISTASNDAVDGTAPNTVMGSPTASMQSSQMPPHSPPRRDPRVATQDWRNQEENATLARGKRRRMRPGVVFDVAENPHEETKRTKLTRSKKPQPQVEAEQPPTTESSDG
ncbi:hypothetical protein B0H14DRAFT_2660231 [Mycena olivaceomarginata]|nr:hypothetical protein B0H14DRAFT_2660231 [Mycena olivaceomarginata]